MPRSPSTARAGISRFGLLPRAVRRVQTQSADVHSFTHGRPADTASWPLPWRPRTCCWARLDSSSLGAMILEAVFRARAGVDEHLDAGPDGTPRAGWPSRRRSRGGSRRDPSATSSRRGPRGGRSSPGLRLTRPRRHGVLVGQVDAATIGASPASSSSRQQSDPGPVNRIGSNAVVEQPPRDVRADEAGCAGDDGALHAPAFTR